MSRVGEVSSKKNEPYGVGGGEGSKDSSFVLSFLRQLRSVRREMEGLDLAYLSEQ